MTKADTASCSIRGSCVLQDGSILLADYNNKMLKRVEGHSLKVTDQCPMQNHPLDVCVINNSEVVVAQDNNALAIISTRPNLTVTRTISMKRYCGCVAYSNAELFITDESSALYIYNLKGSLLRKVSSDAAGQKVFSQIRHIMVNAAGDKIYIADEDKGVIILDRECHVLHKLVIDKIRCPWGLCLDGMGGLFVGGLNSNNVVHVDADGHIQTEVLTKSDGLARPLSLCFNKLRNRLFVTSDTGNQIHMCDLE